jgi:hypothetical protein
VTTYGPVEWFPEGDLIDGAEVLRVPLQRFGREPEMKVKGEFPVTVTFDDPALTSGRPGVFPLLTAILRGVREVVSAFEPDL